MDRLVIEAVSAAKPDETLAATIAAHVQHRLRRYAGCRVDRARAG